MVIFINKYTQIKYNKEEFFMFKGQKGITLVALVITIIVLLILAGITISLTLGQNGIINRAQEAGKNYSDAQKAEMDSLINFIVEVVK